MSRNRRNKRSSKINISEEKISTKSFFIMVIVFIIVIIFCALVIGIRNYNDKQEFARQKEILDMQIKAIFEDKKEKQKDKQDNKQDKENEVIKKDTLINIAVAGDILCNDAMVDDAKNGDTYNFSHMFENVKGLIKNSDLAIGTMETNFLDNTKFSDYIELNSPKEFAKDVKDSGISLVSMAHNHAIDYGYEGLVQTKSYLESLGYTTVGVTTKEDKNRFIIKQIKGIKIAFLSYTYGVNRQSLKTKEELQYVNLFDKDKTLIDIKEAKEKADYIFVIMHWGDVNNTNISKNQEQIGSFLLENGVDTIIGSHPAVVEPMEVITDEKGTNKFIAYSVGNYCSDLGYEYSPLELILNIQIRKDGKTGKVSLDKVTYTPIYMLDNGKNKDNRFTLVDIKDVAKSYAYENKDIITKKQYNILIKGLEKLESIIRSRSKN